MDQKLHIVHIGFHPAFSRVIDFEKYDVSVIVHPFIEQSMDSELKGKFASVGLLNVPHDMNLNAYDEAISQIEELIHGFIEKSGKMSAIVGLFEHVTLPAARMRNRFGVPGTNELTATNCRDKVLMKKALEGSKVRIPRFLEVDSRTKKADVGAFLDSISGGIVLKPRSQAASVGVKIFQNSQECLESLESSGFEDAFELEEFISGTICHFDGVVRGGKILFFSASEYMTSCFDYVENDKPLASVTLDDPLLMNSAKSFTNEVLERIGLSDGVFHLEAFRSKNNILTFLEVANRFGGAGVTPLLKQVYGVDLVQEAVLVDLGLPSTIQVPFTILDGENPSSSAWLYIPIPSKLKCQVAGIAGIEELPGSIFYSELPKIGQWLNEYQMPFPSSGRFFVKAPNAATVRSDCSRIMETYGITVKEERVPS